MTNLSPSADELIQFISDFVRKRYEATHLPVDGTTLADGIRQHYPTLHSYADVGFTRLADAVREAERRGLLTRHREVQRRFRERRQGQCVFEPFRETPFRLHSAATVQMLRFPDRDWRQIQMCVSSSSFTGVVFLPTLRRHGWVQRCRR